MTMMMKINQEWIKYIAILVIGITAGVVITSAFKSSPDMSAYDSKMELLEKRIDSNKVVIKNQDLKIVNFEKYVVKTDSQFVEQQNKINRLKRYYDEKIKAVDNASTAELNKSITDRYNK